MARTTLDLDPLVLEELRRRGSREGKSMGTLASELLASALAESDDVGQQAPFRWRSGRLGAPLIDLEDKEAIRRALDGEP